MQWRLLWLVLALLAIGGRAFAQDAFDFARVPTTIAEFDEAWAALSLLSQDDARPAARALYLGMKDAGRVPLVEDGRVLFLHLGSAGTVEWRGDFSLWESTPETVGARAGESALWRLDRQFPNDARIEYKIVVNRDSWILDPANPNTAGGGFGDNSELRMPFYRTTDVSTPRDGVLPGAISRPYTIMSAALGYELAYSVYLPRMSGPPVGIPTLYVLDGNDFADANIGRLNVATDNLIADGSIEPLMIIFIDARHPRDRFQNRREEQFLENPDYARFLVEEFIPAIEAAYPVSETREDRAVMGTSYGGLAAAYVTASYPDTFGRAAIYSPSFWAQADTIDLMNAASRLPERYFIGTGHPGWDAEVPTSLFSILGDHDVQLTYMQTREGHAWTNWRGMYDETLRALFGV